MSDDADDSIRVAIVGAHPLRVAKVLSLVQQLQEKESSNEVEFLPLVAAFGSYEDEEGTAVKYLANVTFHGVDGRQKGTSVAPFFDDDNPIEVFAIGCGIEDEEDVGKIKTFLSTLGSNLEDVVLECLEPNEEYATIKDETEAYRQLNPEEKRVATEQQSIGPGKMAKFVLKLLQKLKEKKTASEDSEVAEPILAGEIPEDEVVENEEESEEEPPVEFDPEKKRYACRMCREVLFGEDDLEDPPHVPAKQQFDWRRREGSATSACKSIFLGSAMYWMGDVSAGDGKFGCPHCHAKLGNWKWAGAQCSCGSWVTPAIQIPISKVDIMLPKNLDVATMEDGFAS